MKKKTVATEKLTNGFTSTTTRPGALLSAWRTRLHSPDSGLDFVFKWKMSDNFLRMADIYLHKFFYLKLFLATKRKS